MRKPFKKNIRGVVVKVGTSILTRSGRFDKTLIVNLAVEVADFLKKGLRVSIVSSGAIGAGMTILKEKKRPETMQGLQAAAAVGQRFLMQCYEEAFSKHRFSTAQVLLTWDDFADEKRLRNAKSTLQEIQSRGLVSIINENDTIATDEIRFGDNDRLSAHISILLEADLLIILSDTNGLKGAKGERISEIPVGNIVFSHVRDKKKPFTVGGMRSKLEAISMCTRAGIPVLLADGREKNILHNLLKGEDRGTLFLTNYKKGNWIEHFVHHARSRGFLKGAKEVLG